MGRSDDDSSSDSYRRDRKRSKKSSKKHKKRKEEKKRRRKYEDLSDSSDSDDRRRRKKVKKNDKKRRRREEKSGIDVDPLQRNHELAENLRDVLSGYPQLASELPIMLIRLAGGTSFDLRQMTDSGAASGIARVFSKLQTFGVQQDESGCWVWQLPKGGARNELVLVKVVRTMLDQIGLTAEAVRDYENSLRKPPAELPEPSEATISVDIEEQVNELLRQFGSEQLGPELAGLCCMILEGRIISLESLPNAELREGLEKLFAAVGLEQSEMEPDDEDEGPELGYALPDTNETETRTNLSGVLKVCTQPSSAAAKPVRPKGPLRESEASLYSTTADSDDEDEGPVPIGAQVKGPAQSPELVRARAAERTCEMELVKAGLNPADATALDGSTREEWMLVPGKFDFLSSIKSGQSMKSRTFETKAASSSDRKEVLDPAVQAEIDDIVKRHEDSRGPSLMELHRQKKAQESKEGSDKKSWGWNRDKDLDDGRRVDKKALNMVLGGASSDLKKKFHGGFG